MSNWQHVLELIAVIVASVFFLGALTAVVAAIVEGMIGMSELQERMIDTTSCLRTHITQGLELTALLWRCEYCAAMNKDHRETCPNCGAPRRE